jgi:hypothetical protein
VVSDQGSESPFGVLNTATIAAQCGNFYSISKWENRVWADAPRFAVHWFGLLMSCRNKTRKAKPRSGRLMLACVVVFAVLLLLLRMWVYVHGRR